MNNILDIDDRQCGSGKTTDLITELSNPNKDIVVLAAPSKDLLKETQGKVQIRIDQSISPRSNNNSVLITEDEFDKPTKELLERLGDSYNSKHLLGTTQGFTTYVINELIRNKILYKNKHLVIDEVFPGIIHTQLDMRIGFGFMDSLVRTNVTGKPGVHKIKIKYGHENTFRNILKGKGGPTNQSKPFEPLAQILLNSAYDTYTYSDKDLSNVERLNFISIVNPDFLNIFKSTKILSAHYFLSELYHVLHSQDVEHNKLFPKHDHKHLAKGKYVNIKYFTDNNWSRHFRNKRKDGQSNFERIVKWLNDNIEGDFIYNANKAERDCCFNNPNHEAKLVTSMYGVNKYDDYTNAVFLPSFNIPPEINTLLIKLKINPKDINFSRNVLAAYQFCMRTEIRKLDSANQCNFYVMDKRTADFLLSVFPGASVEKIDGLGLVEEDGRSSKSPAKKTPEYSKLMKKRQRLMRKGNREKELEFVDLQLHILLETS